MKTFFRLLIIYFIITQSLFASKITLTEKEKKFIQQHPVITLGIDSNWSPHVLIDKNGKITGYDAEILNLVNKNTGMNFKLITGRWDKIVEKAKKREIDGLSASAIHEERRKYFNFSNVFFSTQRLLIVSHINPKEINSIDDLKGKTIGYQNNNLFEKKFVSQFTDSTLISLNTYDEILDSLIKGNIDATLGSPALIQFAQRKDLPFIKIADTIPSSKFDLVFSIRNDFQEALSILNKGLNSIPKQDKQNIRNKWFFQSPTIIKNSLELTPKEKNYLKEKKVLRVQNLSTFPPFNFNENNIAQGGRVT